MAGHACASACSWCVPLSMGDSMRRGSSHLQLWQLYVLHGQASGPNKALKRTAGGAC